MKNLRHLFTGLTLGALALVAAPKTVRALSSSDLAQVQAPLNLVKNPGFESGLASWTASAPATVSIVRAGSNLLEGFASATFTPSGAGQTLKSTAVVIPNALANASCAVHMIYRGGDASSYMQVVDGSSNVLASATFSTVTSATRVDATFTCPASGVTLQLVIGATGSGALVAVDRTFLGAADLASTGTGAINYVTNTTGASGSSSGYVAYANTAQATPVTGAGGSPTHISIASSALAPIRNSTSLLITNSGSSSAQGEGIAYAFTTAAADEGKVLSIQADYELASGTFVAGTSAASPSDLTVYIYDVTNSIVIQPAGFNLTCSSTTLACHYQGTFQTASNSTSYRLLFHVATANTSAWAMKLANVSVGPITYTSVTPVTDWQPYTPTGTWVTNTTYTGQWRRVGDSIELQGAATLTGAPNNVSLTISIPSGLTIDSSKLPAVNGAAGSPTLGFAQAAHSTNIYNLQLVYSGLGTSVQPVLQNSVATGAQVAINATVPITFASGDTVTFSSIRIPIVGWSSSVQSSDQADSRVVAMFAQGQAGTGTLSSSFNTAKLSVVTKDTHAGYNTTTGIYTVPISGFYTVTGTVDVSSNITAGQYVGCQVTDLTVGYTVLGYQRSPVTSTIDLNPICSGILFANAGDQIALQSVAQGSSLAYSTTTGGSSLHIQRISGPNTISATESVNMSYADTSGGTIGTGSTAYAFGTKLRDSHAAYSGSTFTVPVAGMYRISATLQTANVNLSTAQDVEIDVFQNGTVKFNNVVFGNGASHAQQVAVSGSLPCLAGDTLQIKASASVATTGSIASGVNNLSIERVGN